MSIKQWLKVRLIRNGQDAFCAATKRKMMKEQRIIYYYNYYDYRIGLEPVEWQHNIDFLYIILST